MYRPRAQIHRPGGRPQARSTRATPRARTPPSSAWPSWRTTRRGPPTARMASRSSTRCARDRERARDRARESDGRPSGRRHAHTHAHTSARPTPGGRGGGGGGHRRAGTDGRAQAGARAGARAERLTETAETDKLCPSATEGASAKSARALTALPPAQPSLYHPYYLCLGTHCNCAFDLPTVDLANSLNRRIGAAVDKLRNVSVEAI
jgi:hypothetical protein